MDKESKPRMLAGEVQGAALRWGAAGSAEIRPPGAELCGTFGADSAPSRVLFFSVFLPFRASGSLEVEI